MSEYSSPNFRYGKPIYVYTPISMLTKLNELVSHKKITMHNKKYLYNFLMSVYEEGYPAVEKTFSNKLRLNSVLDRCYRCLNITHKQIKGNRFMLSKVKSRNKRAVDIIRLYNLGNVKSTDVIFIEKFKV